MENSLQGLRDSDSRLGFRGRTLIPVKEIGETKQDRSTKEKDFSADYKYCESRASEKT